MTALLKRLPAHLAEDLLGGAVLIVLLLGSLLLPGVF